MKHLALAFLLALPLPASAQEGDVEQGIDLMGEAMRLFMRGLLSEMEPALENLQELLENIDAYHPPEMLPNGDIIIRRKTPDELADEDGIEL